MTLHFVVAVAGLRHGFALIDRNDAFTAIRARAEAFVWDEELQRRANRWASRQMVGWIEEVHKGLQGVLDGHIGRMLNARHGMSWGLIRVVQVQRGVLVCSDNDLYDAVTQALGHGSQWVRLCRQAFAIDSPGEHVAGLRDQVTAGLRLYAETAELIAPALQPDDLPLISQTVLKIRHILDGLRH